MTFNKFGYVTATACLLSTTAMADVSPQDVWDQWQSMMILYGEDKVTIGNEEFQNGTLTISNIVFNSNDDNIDVNFAVPEIQFKDLGNGTVAVTMTEELPINVEEQRFDGVTSSVKMMITQNQMSLIASGTPDEIDYALLAKSYGFDITSIQENGEEIPVNVNLTLNNVNGNYLVKNVGGKEITYALNSDELNYVVAATDPIEGADFNVSGSITGLSAKADATLPEGMTADFTNPFASGMTSDALYEYETSNVTFEMTDGTSSVTANGSDKGGFLSAKMTPAGLSYETEGRDAALSIQTTDFPFPIDIAFEKIGFGLEMPLTKSDEAAPFGTKINLSNFTVSNGVWNLFDPGEILPRDPATLLIDLAGSGKWNFDLMDPEQAAAVEDSDEFPGEIESLNLNALTLAVAGAVVSGEGAFTFDNTDLTTFDGMPRPTGEVNLEATGVNGLIDKLVTMGLLPQEQAIGARMMLGLFTDASETEDKLTSKLEVTEDGQVTANGQRLR